MAKCNHFYHCFGYGFVHSPREIPFSLSQTTDICKFVGPLEFEIARVACGL